MNQAAPTPFASSSSGQAGASRFENPGDEAVSTAMAKLEDLIVSCLAAAAADDRDPLARFRRACAGRGEPFTMENLALILEALEASGREALPPEQMQAAVLCFVDRRREDGRLPAAVDAEGRACYRLEDRQGFAGGNGEWTATAAWAAFRLGGGRDFAAAVAPALIQGLNQVARDAKTGLIEDSNPIPGADKKSFRLRPSLLFFQAAHHLAEILRELQQEGEGDYWQHCSQLVAKSIRIYFWNKKAGLFRTTSAAPDLVDIQGSALSVYQKSATSGQLMTIARTFQRQFGQLIRGGAVRQLLDIGSGDSTPARDGLAQSADDFSLEAVGWFVYALDFADSARAEQLFLDVAARILGHRDAVSGGHPDLPAACRLLTAGRALLERRSVRPSRD